MASIRGKRGGAARSAAPRTASGPRPGAPAPPHRPAAAPRGRPAPAPRPLAAPAEAPSAPQVRHETVGEGGDGQRLDNFLASRLKGVPASHVHRLIRGGEVRVNKGRAQAATRLSPGDVVRIPPVRVAQRDVALDAAADPRGVPLRDFAIVHEDDALLVVDKPAGLAVHGGSGVAFGVIEQLRRARPTAPFLELVHRLDRETSGLLVVAKKRSALTRLQALWRGAAPPQAAGSAPNGAADAATRAAAAPVGGPVVKRYLALVTGRWPASRRVIDLPLVKGLDARGERHVRVAGGDEASGAQRAITLARVVEALPAHTLLELTLKTGRTHQIRVHLAHHGQPIVGDTRYGDFGANHALARGPARFERMALHAASLAFDHPATGARLELSSPLPAPIGRLLATLRLDAAGDGQGDADAVSAASGDAAHNVAAPSRHGRSMR